MDFLCNRQNVLFQRNPTIFERVVLCLSSSINHCKNMNRLAQRSLGKFTANDRRQRNNRLSKGNAKSAGQTAISARSDALVAGMNHT